MEMPPLSSMKFLATAAVSMKLFMLLARNFSSTKSINNAVESSFQSFMDLDGAVSGVRGTMNLNPSSSGTGNLDLETVHGEKDRRKWDRKKKFEKHSACVLCSEKDKRKCDLKIFF
jgi:hypothetical protein